MSEKPLISIIIPVFNGARFIRRCYESVAGQTYPNLEIIIVDDGSTDSTPEILSSISREDIRVKIITKNNGGVSSARNTGISNSTGEYISFVDADDVIKTECIDVLYSILVDYKCDVSAITVEKGDHPFGIKENETVVMNGVQQLEETMKDNPVMFTVWGKLFSKSIIGKTRFDEQIHLNEDTLFVFEILLKKPGFVVRNSGLYVYTLVPGSASRGAFSDKYFDVLKVAEKKKELLIGRQEFSNLVYLAENVVIKAKMNLLQNLVLKTKYWEYRDVKRKLIKDIRDNKEKYIFADLDYRWFFVITHYLLPVWIFKNKIIKEIVKSK